LTDDTIAALLGRRLDSAAAKVVARHIEQCADCERLVAEAARAMSLGSRGRDPAWSDTRSTAASGDRAIGSTSAAPPDDLEPGAPPLPPGTAVGRYVVVECIGAGGMGVVYLARDPELGRRVALKLVRADGASSPSSSGRARLLREAQAMAQLSHPNVITVHDVGTFSDGVFLAMELIEGGTLADWFRGKERSWREVVDILRRAGDGLAAAHAAGFVHRDFKPDNVLVGDDGRVRVTDFGLARSAEARDASGLAETRPADLLASMTRTGTLLGTPAYMAPEQLAGAPADVRSDVFSFCATFYEALYGVRPYQGSTLNELRDAIAKGSMHRGASATRVPAWLRRLVVRGLRSDPDARPQGVRALFDAIDARLARGRKRSVLGVVVGIACMAAAFATLGAIRARMRARPSSPPVAAPSPTRMTDVPAPASANAAAVAAYQSGVQKLHDRDPTAEFDLARAAELDPSLYAAHLRYALVTFQFVAREARAHLARAVAGRRSLSERDRLLLAAAQAWMQSESSDAQAFARVADEAHERFPLDAELAYWAAVAHSEAGDRAGAILRADRALALDPAFGAVYELKSIELAYAGDLDAALATTQECALRAPNAMGCLGTQIYFDADVGNCRRLEQTSRQLLARDPETPHYKWLASAAYAQGESLETVREMLRQHDQTTSTDERPYMELLDAWVLDVLSGDFVAARTHARELEQRVVSERDETWHARAAFMSIETDVESGRATEAGRRVTQFLNRKYAWMSGPVIDYSLMRDPTPRMLLAERQAGLLAPAAFEFERERWATDHLDRASARYRPFVWLYGYAAVAETAEDAAKALAEQPRFGAIPWFQMVGLPEASVGSTYLLAGRTDEALPWLERASRSCLAVFNPVEHTRVHVALGQALAALCRRDEACAAYGIVLTRWGRARPRSVTAEKARTLAGALECPAFR